MTTPPPSTQSVMLLLKLAAVAFVALLLGSAGCYWLLPIYEHVEAGFLLGEGHAAYMTKQDSQALSELNQAIALDPKSVAAYTNRGEVYIRNKEYDLAIADFKQALDLNPQNEQCIINLGDAYENKSDYRMALSIYEKAIMLHPKLSLAYNNYAWLLATCPAPEFRDGKKAVTYATQACELSNWQDPASLDTLASADAEIGEFDNAVKWENQAMSTPGFGADDMDGARARLALYQAHKAYHRDEP